MSTGASGKSFKRRIISKQYFNDNWFYLAQIWERNCFKRWITIGVGSTRLRAEKFFDDL